MKALARQRATYDDLVNVPENMVAELIDGDLYASPRPAGPHADMSSVLGMLIGFPYRLGRGGPAVGGLSTNRSSTLASRSSFPISQVGAGSECLGFPMIIVLSSSRTGFAK
jgi:hypothetical protein